MQLTSTAKSIYNLRKLPFLARLAKGTGTLGAILLSLSAFQAQAQVPIVYYDFETDNNRSVLETNVDGTTISATSITRNGAVSITGTSGPGLSLYSGSAGTAIQSSFTNTTSIDPNTGASEYYELRFTKSGFQNLTLQLDILKGTDGPAKFGLLYKLDNGALTHLETRATPVSWNTQSFTLPASFNTAGDVFLYIYGYQANGSGGNLLIDNIMVTSDAINSGTATLLNEADVYAGFTSGGTGNYTRSNLAINGTANIDLNYPLEVTGAVSVGSGATLKFGTANAKIEGSGSFTLNSGASIEIASPAGITSGGNTGNIQTTSRIYDSGAHYKFIQNDGSASATGDGLPATISGSLTIALLDNIFVGISNPIILSNPSTSITGTLNLLHGILNTTSNTLTIVKDGTDISGASAASFIQGPLAYEVTGAASHTLNFEIGSGANYRKVTLAVNHTDGNTATYTATQIEGAAPGNTFTTGGDELDRVSAVRYFTLTKGGSAVTNNEQVTLSYGTNDKVNQPSTLRIANYNGANWTSMGGTGSGVTGTITSSLPLSTFGSFALGNAKGGTNPLPVELASFTATKKGCDVILDWSTASEKDNKGFDVQVSNNSNDFRDLGFVASKNSNATAMQAYQFIDKESGKTGTRYYRLKQTDLDGTVTYSALKVVTFGKGKMQEIAVYPNPFEQNLTLEVAGKMNQNATVEITDALGKVVYTMELNLLEGTNNTAIKLPVSVTKGLYTLAVKTADGVSYQKIIKK